MMTFTIGCQIRGEASSFSNQFTKKVDGLCGVMVRVRPEAVVSEALNPKPSKCCRCGQLAALLGKETECRV